MPGKVKVKIISGKNLPVMDRSSDTTDAYVEIKLGNTTYKTDVCRRTLHPQWNTDWYKFEVDDSELQDEPLQIRLMDHDTYSANDAIGKVYLNLNPLLLPVARQLDVGDNNPHHEISGWIPVFDTMHGIRGEVNVTVKVQLFSDSNRFRQSSCGVHFFYSPTVPEGYQAKVINGFVEELIVDDDPEYQWIDKIRTPRASNEARQTLFFKLSGELQRKIGVKALSLGGNAVIGYRQCFDLEGESGIVARGIGTAVTLVKATFTNLHHIPENKEEALEKYLKFVGDGKSFSLCPTSPSHNAHFPFSPIVPFDVPPVRVPKVAKRQYASFDSHLLSPSVSNPNIDEPHIQGLLNQEDSRGKSAIFGRFQKFKHSQKSLSKKMIALKAKINDSIGEEGDDILGTSSDKRKHFKRTSSDSSAMAEILARSVMRATSSLTCILEDQPQTPKEEETLDKLQPIANLLHQSETPETGLDEAGSDAQSCSSTESSSTSSEYNYRDYSRVNTDVETLSNIITNVEKLQRCLSREGLYKQYSLPAIPTKGFSLSSLDNCSQFDSTYTIDNQMIEPGRSRDSLGKSELSISSSNLSHLVEPYPPIIRLERRTSDIYDSRPILEAKKIPKLKRSHEIDLSDSLSVSNNMLSTSLPTKIFEKSKIFTIQSRDDSSLSNSSSQIFRKSPTKKSATSKSVDHIHSEAHGLVKTALQTMLVDRAESLGATVSASYQTNQTHSPLKKESQTKGIVKTALQTMLVERADLLGAPKEKVSNPVKKPEVESSPRGIVDTALKTMLVERADILGAPKEKIREPVQEVESEQSSKGIVNTALKTMLLERAELINSHPENVFKNASSETQQFSPENVGVLAPVSLDNVTVEPKKMVKTAMQTMLLEKFNILGTYTPPTSPNLGDSHAGSNFTFSNSGPKRKTIPKSSSTASFGGQKEQRETVLGMPFASLSSLVTDYDVAINQQRAKFLLDDNPDEPLSQVLTSKSNRKKRFKFLSPKPDDNGKTSHGMFNRLRRLSKRGIHDDLSQKEGNILSRIFASRNDEKMKDESTQTSLELLTCPLSAQIPSNNKTEPKITITTPKPPGHTDLASGDFLAHSKTKSACITSHQSPPAQERQGQDGSERTDEQNPDPAAKVSQSPIKVNYMVPLHRRSSDSDLSITPKGNSLTGSDKSAANVAAYFMRNNYIRRGQLNQEHFDLLEYPFLTMTKFPQRFIIQIGGSISARSVKLLERILNVDEPESRDIWWSEIRMEIRSHARSLNCNAVLGYSESTSICDDVCVLSACGTAAVIDFSSSAGDDENFSTVQLIHKNVERDKQLNGHHKTSHDSPDHRMMPLYSCFITHLPYDEKTVPLKAKVTKCPMCIKGKVPEVLISTIEPPDFLPIVGRGCFIESHVSRPLRDLRGETFAKEISDGLPFLEYELHRLLVNKLKIKGMNAVFSLKIRISVGDKMMVGVATGTAVYLPCLPSPDLPLLVTDKLADKKLVADLQEILHQTVKKNREIYQIMDDNENQKSYSDEESDEDPGSLDISCGNKDCCILEMDDPEDAEVLRLLMQEKVPDGFHVVNTESVPGLDDLEIVKNLQMFTQIYRAKLVPPYNLQKHFVRLLQSVYFKLRRMVPCALCDLQFRIDVPEPDEIQLCVIGMALGLGKKGKKNSPAGVASRKEDELIFKLDEDPQENAHQVNKSNTSSLKYRNTRSPLKYRPQSIKQRHIPAVERHGVDITPLSYVPGGVIEQYLGNLNFFFIRETTSIREEGGLSGFIHSFITEVLAIVRSHVTALGGNALVAFFMTECVLNHNLHKNQGQCLINVGGDVVSVSYIKNDP